MWISFTEFYLGEQVKLVSFLLKWFLLVRLTAPETYANQLFHFTTSMKYLCRKFNALIAAGVGNSII